ncbi:MAG: 50S ribosomal protein L9 [Blastocatellia bacterium]|nr:50S ribosomal protein L9 [Blastocatellia bacterium]MBL8195664.1 50S ribosomal protein L9 [Blastocatellia bacterium]MBN8723951.1 50S ribosomal protein L9 [Acidobacteriota bacterium]
MEILLLEDMENLGARGEIVRVKAGYGRNYLLPRKFALAATPSNQKMIEQQRKSLLKREAAEKASASAKAEALKSLELVFERKVGEHGILYGSVTALDIAEEMTKKGYEVDKRRIVLKDPIKSEGQFEVTVKLHREVSTVVNVVVNKKDA